MAENTKIQWTTHTMNFWTGCQEVSMACDNCYARWQWAARVGRDFHERLRTTEANWRKAYKWHKLAFVNSERAYVFTNSLADFLDNQVPQEWRDDACILIDQCTSLDWQILTKRPQNAPRLLPRWMANWPPHVWLGASAGDRVELERNLRHLRTIPAKNRFLSLEPLLEHVGDIDLTGISWVIVGGESGAKDKIRITSVEWISSIVEQCREQHVACFVKQLGGAPFNANGRVILRDRKGGDPAEWPENLRVREMPYTVCLGRTS